jgi:hypothetical protein
MVLKMKEYLSNMVRDGVEMPLNICNDI